MRRRAWAAAVAATGMIACFMIACFMIACFKPTPPEGVRCSESGDCPPGQACEPASNTCQVEIYSDEVVACDVALPCPSSDGITACGRIHNLASGRIVGPTGDDRICDPEAPSTDGPCSLALRFFDAYDLSVDGLDAEERYPEDVRLDACGRWWALNVPTDGALAVVIVDDARDDTGHAHVPTATFVARERVADLPIFEVDVAQADAWGAATGGATLDEAGMLLVTYRDGDDTEAGRLAGAGAVKVTIDDEPSVAGVDAFYFAEDPDVAIATELTSTTPGPGAAIMRSVDGSSISGIEGEPDGCTWDYDDTLYVVPGVVMARTFEAVGPDDDDFVACPD